MHFECRCKRFVYNVYIHMYQLHVYSQCVLSPPKIEHHSCARNDAMCGLEMMPWVDKCLLLKCCLFDQIVLSSYSLFAFAAVVCVGLPEVCKLLIGFGASLEAVDQLCPQLVLPSPPVERSARAICLVGLQLLRLCLIRKGILSLMSSALRQIRALEPTIMH